MATRVQLLAVRVRWLDRHRRAISLGVAALAVAMFVARVDSTLGSDWPWPAAVAFALVLGAIAWWSTEIALAWLAAVWETEYDQLVRDRGLPRAIVLRKWQRPRP